MNDIFARSEIEEDLSRIEDMLHHSLQSGYPELGKVSGHIIFSGGKRIRPAMGVTVYRASGGLATREVYPLAVALELVHTATLIHDDILDGSNLRRGALSVHKRFGKNKALITGDFLFARAFGLCSRYGQDIIDVAANAGVRLAEGEMIQMSVNLENITMERYMSVITRKTADLFSTCARIAAMLAKAPRKRIEAMGAFGQNVGLVFQIIDDLLDLTGSDLIGKPKGLDIKEGKPTLAMIRARDQLGGRARKELLDIFARKRRKKADVARAVALVQDTDGVEFARRKARLLMEQALKKLTSLDSSTSRDLLERITRYSFERQA